MIKLLLIAFALSFVACASDTSNWKMQDEIPSDMTPPPPEVIKEAPPQCKDKDGYEVDCKAKPPVKKHKKKKKKVVPKALPKKEDPQTA